MYPNASSAVSDDYYGSSSSSSSDPTTDTAYRQNVASINAVYIIAGIIHLLNAVQYIYAWFPLGYGLLTWVMVPEYLNVAGAALYLAAASQYNQAYSSEAARSRIHVIETIASAIEVGAAFGWTAVWWVTHARGRGRGLTLDDPDFSGNALIIVPSIIYLVYNVNNLRDANNYFTGPNALLYQTADLWYFVGSLIYLASAARDDGWFPSFGVFGAAVFGALGALARARVPGAAALRDWLTPAGPADAKPLLEGPDWPAFSEARETPFAM